MPRVAIVGGGIAGLAAAHALRRSQAEAEVVVLEQEQRVGGKILTERVDGFVIEAGPDSFLTSKPGGLDLCRQLGIEGELQGTRGETRRTFVMHDGALHETPQGLSGLVPAHLGPLMRSNLFSSRGKARLALEAIVPGRRDERDEALGAFMRRRFGREAYERLIEPLMSGIYGGDGESLSLYATFPHLAALERRHGSLLRGIAATQKSAQSGASRPAFVAPEGGMGRLIEALEQELGAAIRRGAAVIRLHAAGRGYAIELGDGKRVDADAVILATPAFISGALLQPLDAELASLLDAIPYASTASVSLAFEANVVPRLDGHGYIIPRREGRPVLACTWTSSKFANRAPEGTTLLRAFLGRAGREEILQRSDNELVAAVRDELRATLGVDAEPLVRQIYRWSRGMPQYTVGHAERVDRIEERLAAYPGLLLAGAAYRGVGIPDCISSAERAAEAAMRSLTGTRAA